jgi:membrane fusion protein (multidrug efflux system)
MKLPRHILGILSFIIIVSALGAGVWYRLRPEQEGGASDDEATQDSTALPSSASQQFATDVPQPVVGAEVIRDTLWISVTAAGQAEAVLRAVVPAQVPGTITEAVVEENQRVEEGDLLLQIDTTEYALSVARARADLVTFQARYQEMTFGTDDITDPQARLERDRLARARSGLAQGEVALREAEIALERTSVRAPFGGRVADLLVVLGQQAAAGAELLTVVDLDPIKVEVQVLEADIGFITEGRRASVTFAAFPRETFSGRISTINPIVDPTNRTARVTVLLSNPQGRIKPGMYARVSLDANYFPDRILVPRTAILEKDRRTMLFVFEDGRAKWRYVTTGMENDTQIEIVPNDETSMVEPGEVVLVDNHYYIIHDAPIQLVETVPPPERGAGQ